MPEPAAPLAPAYYATRAKGWRRDVWALLHPPYTAWHLSYVLIGAGLAPRVDITRLVATLVAFFLAVGVSAHALDELRGRPLQTQIPEGVLWTAAIAGLVGAVALGCENLLQALDCQRPAGREQRRFNYVLDLVFIHCIGRPWRLGERGLR